MQTIGESNLKETLVGGECNKRFGVLVLSRPVINGVVVNWEDFEIVLRHHFITTLQVDITRHPVIISTGSRNSDGLSSNQSDTANILKLMLSRFNAPLVSLQPEWKLIAYASKAQTALIVSLGDSVSYVAPIVDGKELVFATKLLPVNGALITDRLIKLFGEAGVGRFETMSEQSAIRSLKENHAFVRDALIEEEEMKYEMPDGSFISVPTRLLSECVEVLFDSTLAGFEKDVGVVEAAYRSVLAVENTEIRKSLLQNIILCGGTAQIKNFGSRFLNDMKVLLATNEATQNLEPTLLYPKTEEELVECGNLAWRGACEFAAHNKDCLWMKSK
jgi:actin-related protein